MLGELGETGLRGRSVLTADPLNLTDNAGEGKHKSLYWDNANLSSVGVIVFEREVNRW